MSRADLLVSLVKAGSEGDQRLLRSTVEAMAAEERAKSHHQLADRLVKNLGEARARAYARGGALLRWRSRRIAI